jgi:anti-sigma B factor antagonist
MARALHFQSRKTTSNRETKMSADIILVIRNASLQGSTVKSLRSELRRLVAPGRKLTLHMAGVESVDTQGAGAILEIARKLRECGGTVRLVGLQNKVIAFFELLRLQRSIEIYGSQSEAVAMTNAA